MDKNPTMDQTLLDKLHQIIESNLTNEQFGVAELASESGMSRSQLHRRLNSHTKKSASQFIREHRLEKARRLLQDETASVAEVAYMVGFGSPSYFNTCFHEFYGYPPGDTKRKQSIPSEQQFQSKLSKASLIAIVAIILLVLSYFSFQSLIGNRNDKSSKISLAVVPFKNLSDDQENQYFVDGQAEDIRNHLASIANLDVKSKTDVEIFRESSMPIAVIASELNVSHIIEGTGQKIGNQIRLTINLIEAKSGNIIWSKPYDGVYSTELLNFQRSVAKELASELNTVITPKEAKMIDQVKTDHMLAYDNLIRGQYERDLFLETSDKKHLGTAKKHLTEALKIDPNYVEAYVSMASIFVPGDFPDSLYYYAEQALQIDPNHPNANNRMARYHQANGQHDQAIYYYSKALEFDPKHINSNIFIGQVYCIQKKDIRKGYPYLVKAWEMIGRTGEEPYNLAKTFWTLGLYDKARTLLKNYPNTIGICRAFGGINDILITEGKYQEALQYTDSISPLIGCEEKSYKWYIWIYTKEENFLKADLYLNKWKEVKTGQDDFPEIGMVYHELGRLEDADNFFQQYLESHSDQKSYRRNNAAGDYRRLKTYAFQNRIPEALATIEIILDKGVYVNLFDKMKHDPMIKNLWNYPEFKKVFQQVQDEKKAIRTQVQEIDELKDLNL